MGANNGTGQPFAFRCGRCRRTGGNGGHYNPRTGRREHSRNGWVGSVSLTGRKRPQRNQGRGGSRVSDEEREYECGDCGHVGWSRHSDLEDKENSA
jgi:hypothetical protein